MLKKQIGTLQQSLTESERMIADYRIMTQKLETNKSEIDRIQNY